MIEISSLFLEKLYQLSSNHSFICYKAIVQSMHTRKIFKNYIVAIRKLKDEPLSARGLSKFDSDSTTSFYATKK